MQATAIIEARFDAQRVQLVRASQLMSQLAGLLAAKPSDFRQPLRQVAQIDDLHRGIVVHESP